MKKSMVAAILLMALPEVLTIPVKAEEPLLPSSSKVKLSPNGEKISCLVSRDGITKLYLFDVATSAGEIIQMDTNASINDYKWVTDRFIISIFSGGDAGEYFFIIYDTNTGQNLKVPAPSCHNLRFCNLSGNREDLLPVEVRTTPDIHIYDLYALDATTGKLELFFKNPGHIIGWICDDNGEPYFATGIKGLRKSFQKIENNTFIDYLEGDFVSNCMLFGTTDNSGRIFEISSVFTDKLAVYEIDKFGKRTKLFEDSSHNVGGWVRDVNDVLSWVLLKRENGIAHVPLFESDNIVGEILSFFEGKNTMLTSIDKAKRRALVSVSEADGYPKHYLFDKDTRTAIFLYDDGARVKTFSNAQVFYFEARDGLGLHGYFTPPWRPSSVPPPAVVLVHGGPNDRDSYSPSGLVQHFAARGMAVIRINYRGSIEFGKKIESAGHKQWGKAMQDDITDGVQWLVTHKMIDKDRIAIMGASYGGYAAIQALVSTPDLYKCGIGINGFYDLREHVIYKCKVEACFKEVFYKTIGDPTKEADMLKAISPAHNYDKISCPVLLYNGALDQLVSPQNVESMLSILKQRGLECRQTIFEDEGHAYKNKENIDKMYSEIFDFIGRHLKLSSPKKATAKRPLPQNPETNNPKPDDDTEPKHDS